MASEKRDNRIDTDEDFVVAKKFKNSLNGVLDAPVSDEKAAKDLPFSTIAKFVDMSIKEVEEIYARAMRKLRRMLQ